MNLRIIILFLIFFSNTIAEEISGIPKIIEIKNKKEKLFINFF